MQRTQHTLRSVLVSPTLHHEPPHLVRVGARHKEVGDGCPLRRAILVQSWSFTVQGFGELHHVAPCAIQPSRRWEQIEYLRIRVEQPTKLRYCTGVHQHRHSVGKSTPKRLN